MSQVFQATEGIILRVIPFRDYDQILSLFTADAGLIKVLTKGSRSKRRERQGSFMPLTQVEVIYCEKKGEIFGCHEMVCIESFSTLRKELLFLEVACDLLHTISVSQFMGKASPQLYALLLFYLKKIPQTAYPWILAASFRLKLLKHDGLTIFPFICYECQQPLEKEAFIQECQSWCSYHQPKGSQVCESLELQMLYRLATSQSYQEISSCNISPHLQNQICAFFDACICK